MEKFRLIEILLAEMVIYFLVWLANDYLATLVSLVFGVIFLLILLISLIVEWIERSKVPLWYYHFMAVSIIAPALSAGLYLLIFGELSWMEE